MKFTCTPLFQLSWEQGLWNDLSSQDCLLVFLQKPAHPNQTRKIPPGPAAGDLISGILKLFSAFRSSTLHYFHVMLLHVREIPYLFLHSALTPGLRNSRPPTPKRSLKCNLKSNLLFLPKILENCTLAAVTPQWECQFQSISERALETFPSPKTASPAVSSLLESHNHLSPVILLDSSAALAVGAGKLCSDYWVTHADLVPLFADLVLLVKHFVCQPSQSCFCLRVCVFGNVTAAVT